jgi:O-antigen/teichoic acid export membrane protein
MREVMGFGGKTLLQGAASSGLYQANSILLAFFLGPAALAVFSRHRALVLHLLRFVKQYAQVFVPTSSRFDAQGDRIALQDLLIQTGRYGAYVTIPTALTLIIMGGPLLHVWMGANYRAPWVLAVLVLGHLPAISQLGVYSVLMGMGRHGRPALFDLCAASVSIALALLFLGPFRLGLLGAALAIALPVAVSGGALMPLYACRLVGLSAWRYQRQIAARPLLTCIPLAGCLLFARFAFANAPSHALIAGTGAGGLITLILYWNRVLPRTFKTRLTSGLRTAALRFMNPAYAVFHIEPKRP